MKFAGPCRLLAAVAILILPALTASGDAPAILPEDSAFISYLKEPPWIKEMHFRQSQLFETSTRAGYIDKKQWVNESYQAAVQPAGFYLERFFSRQVIPQGSRYIPARRSIMGTSDKYYWTAYWGGDLAYNERSLTLDPKSPQAGSSADNDCRHLLETYRDQLEKIQFLGFPRLRKDSIALTSGSQFTADTVNEGLIRGNILSLDHGQPQSLEYEKPDGAQVTVRYLYHTGSVLPDGFALSETNSRLHTSTVCTNLIDQIKYGTDTAAVTGYEPSAFFKDLSKFNQVEIWSNGVSYTLGPKGEVLANNQARVLPMFSGVNLSRPQEGRLTLGSVIFVSSMIAGAIIWTGKSKKHNQ